MRLPVLVAAAAVLISCDHNPLEAPLSGGPQLAPPGQAVIVTQIGPNLPADPLEITGTSVTGDTLSLTLRYQGGCAAHSFGFVVSANFTAANPVEASSVLTHNAGGDPCVANVVGTVRFDLSPVRDHFRTTFGVIQGEVLFRIEPGNLTARYLF